MILRRIIGNIRARDWFTVAIEFLIVVVGIFAGLEVSNWNEERKLAAQELGYLELMRDEIAENLQTTDYQARYNGVVVAAGRRALAFLDGDGDCADACGEVLVDLFHASQVWGSGYRLARFREAERLGFPGDPEIRAAVEEFYLGLGGWGSVTDFAPAYRESVRGHITPQAFDHLWRDCYVLEGSVLEELTRDCVDLLRGLDSRAIVRAVHADSGIAGQLRFWLGQNILATELFPAASERGEAAIAALNRELAGTR